MIGSLEILESGVAFPGQTASWEIESCKHRKSQISSRSISHRKGTAELPSEKCPECGA